jgi:hypothetical protein
MAFVHWRPSKAARSLEWATKTRTPGSFARTSWTKVFGGVAFSRASMSTGQSCQGPVACRDADEHQALEPEALLRIIQHLGDRLGVAPIKT